MGLWKWWRHGQKAPPQVIELAPPPGDEVYRDKTFSRGAGIRFDMTSGAEKIEVPPGFARPGVYNRLIMPPVRPDMIPASSWGSSLHNLLTRDSWNLIRHAVIRGGEVCRLCGDPCRYPEVHELWSYRMPPPGSKPDDPEEVYPGVQRLMGLIALCQDCHRIFHPGLANVSGRGEDTAWRMMNVVNEWDPEDYELWWRDAVRLAEARSKWFWVLDLALVRRFQPLVIDVDRGWRIMEQEGHPILHHWKGSRWDAKTALLSVSYSVGDRLVPALNPAQALDGLEPEMGDLGFVAAMGNGLD